MNLTKVFWEKAYKENASKMKGVCHRYVSDNEIAEDLMHDAFLTAINKHTSYKGIGSFEAWLRKITVNTALMYLREKKSKNINADLMQNENEYQTIEEMNVGNIRDVVEQADFSDTELIETIDKLPEHHKLVFNLYVIDNFTHVQIGKELNISSGTSKSHLARARKKIQQLLYEKALEKPQEQKRKKRAAFLFIISHKSHYIDKLSKDKLLNYAIEPIHNSSSFFDPVNWDNVSLPIIKANILNVKVNYWFIGASCGIIIFSSLLVIKNYTKDNIVPVNYSISIDSFNTKVAPIDSLKTKSKTDTVLKKDTLTKQSPKVQPVIIKKMVTLRKIVTIRDTVKIIDTINAY
jgi:RNA polymerase sigma factor (sigma-70 family)